MKKNMTGFLCLFSLLFIFLGSPASGATNISLSPSWDSTGPRMAVDSLGNIHVVWGEVYAEGSGDAFYAKYDITTGKWSAPLNLTGSGFVYTEEKRPVGIDIDAMDNIYVVHVAGPKVRLRICSAGEWSEPFTVHSWNSGEADSARVAVDANGNIFVIWWAIEGGYAQSRARIDGVWENVQRLSLSGKTAKFPDIAVGNNVAFACWTQREVKYQIFYTRRDKTPGAAWSAPQLVYGGSLKQQVPAVEVDGSDIAHVVWTPVWDEDGSRTVRYSYWTGTGFAPHITLSRRDLLHYPYMHEQGGNIYVCWQLGPFGGGTGIFYNHKIGGTWTGELMVPGSQGSTFSDVCTSPLQDKIYYVWNAAGEIWCDMSGGIPGPPNDPPVANFTFSPTSGVYPLQVNFDASASYDPDGSISSYSWDFGDGKYDTGVNVSHVYETWGTFTIKLLVRDNRGAAGAKSAIITVQRLAQPINIRWETHVDESLFLTRYVNEVKWDPNPLNTSAGVTIVLQRVWRKMAGEPNSAFKAVAEVTANVYSYMDKDVKGKNLHAYTVTVIDSQGNESPIAPSGALSPNKTMDNRLPQVLKKRGKLEVS
jgi:PKD repeat protein